MSTPRCLTDSCEVVHVQLQIVCYWYCRTCKIEVVMPPIAPDPVKPYWMKFVDELQLDMFSTDGGNLDDEEINHPY